MDTIVLWLFMKNILYYEEGIYNIIKYYTKSYTFKDNKELHLAFDLWCDNRLDSINRYGHISYWDVSKITDMRWVCANCYYFNDDISRWDTSNVTNMCHMFFNSCCFNQDLSGWNINNVIKMDEMFRYCFIKDKYKPKQK